MNRGKLFKYISNISFGLGAVLAVFAIYFVISSRVGGICPVGSHLGFIIPAIVLLITAFVTSFFAEKSAKAPRQKSDSSDDNI